MDGRGPAAASLAAGRAGRLLPARDQPLPRVPHLLGVVRDRLQRGQAQHLRLPGAGPEDLHAGPGHRQEGDAGVPVQLPAHQEAGDHVDSRRHVVLGHGRAARRAVEPAHRADHVPAGRRRERRTAVRAAAARHPRHDRDVLLLRHRPLPVRRGQHRDGGHPQAPRDGQGRGEDRTGRPAQPGGQGAAAGHPARRGPRSRTPTRRRSPSSPPARTSGCPSRSTGTGRSAARPSRSTARASASPRASGASGSPSSSG